MAKAVQLVDKNNNKCYPAPYWPIGSIYISVTNTNPSEWFGGTWEVFGTGRCLVGVDTSQSEFNTVMKTGGSKYLQSHNHTFSANTNTTGGHNHGLGNQNSNSPNYLYAETYTKGWQGNITTSWGGDHYHSVSGSTSNNGSGNSQNLQPYITVYMWRRTA